jgi:hypothetical protein
MNTEELKNVAAVSGVQAKLPLILDEQGDFLLDKPYKYTLVRLNDGLTKRGDSIGYVEWNEDRTFKELHDTIQVGRSVMLNPGKVYAWLTTTVTQIFEQREDYVKFETENSLYELKII